MTSLFKTARLALFLCSILWLPQTHAVVVFIDGKAGGATLQIDPGIYRAEIAGGAWNAWGGAVGNGQGWLNNWGASLPGGGSIWHGTGVYSTPIDAWKAAQPIYFTVPSAGTMVFTNGDPKQFLADNVGGTSISITKSLGSAKKDAWNLAGDIADFAGQVTGLVALVLAAAEFGSAGALATIAAFTALGLAAIPLALLGSAGTSGGITAALIGVRDFIKDLAIQATAGGLKLTTALKVGLLGLATTATVLVAKWQAADPPNFDYKTVPQLQTPQFPDTDDGRFLNVLLQLTDAGRVNLDAFERMQGAQISGADAYAALQQDAMNNAAVAFNGALSQANLLAEDLFSHVSVPRARLSATQVDSLAAEFLAADLDQSILLGLSEAGLSETDFKMLAVARVKDGPQDFGSDDLKFYFDRSLTLTADSARGLLPAQVPEPGALALVITALLLLARTTSRRSSAMTVRLS